MMVLRPEATQVYPVNTASSLAQGVVVLAAQVGVCEPVSQAWRQRRTFDLTLEVDPGTLVVSSRRLLHKDVLGCGRKLSRWVLHGCLLGCAEEL